MIAPPPRNVDASWSFDLPEKLRLAIADAIVVFGRLETISLELVWTFEDSTLAEKKELTRDFVTKNFKKIKKVVKRMPGATTDKIWPTLQNLADERNLIAHGFWSVNENMRPVVLSHKFLESEDYVSAEYFDYARFEHFMKRADHLLNTFRQFKVMLDQMTRDERIAAGFTLPKKAASRRQRIAAFFRRIRLRLCTLSRLSA